MESKQLKQAIDKHLFISLDDELITQLHEVANSMVADLDAVSVSDYVCSFMQNNVSQSFTDAFGEKYEEMYGDVVILNFANPDMVGHTGVLTAAVKAMETVDACAGKIVEKVLAKGGRVCITADHGNLEKMVGEDGQPYTALFDAHSQMV